jgi:hypothetical protein
MMKSSSYTSHRSSWLFVMTLMLLHNVCCALSSSSSASLSQSIRQHAASIAALKDQARQVLGDAIVTSEAPYTQDAFYVRYCLAAPDNDASRQSMFAQHLTWRTSPQGQTIAPAAHKAIQQAMTSGSWQNDPVLNAAPSGATIRTFLTPTQCLTTTTRTGNLCYCVRAGRIRDSELMQAVTQDELIQFFVYVKHAQSIIANQRSVTQDRLVQVLTANDLSGVKLVGGGDGAAQFRQALSAASKITADLYPLTAGPTLLLNLPTLLQALVQLFRPLFPPSVQARLQFVRGVIDPSWELPDITVGGSHREEFLQALVPFGE